MANRLNTVEDGATLRLGGGGASAPTKHHEPMLAPGSGAGDFNIAPGRRDPAWDDPDYAKLPWQRQLVRVEYYADELTKHHVKEKAPALRKVTIELEAFAKGKQLNVTQLEAALFNLAKEYSHPDFWAKAMRVDIAPVRGVGDHFNAHDASEMLIKLRQVIE